MSIGLIVLATRSSGTGIQLAGDGVGDVAQLLLLLLEILGLSVLGVLLKPVGGFLDGFEKLDCVSKWLLERGRKSYSLLVILINLATKTFIIIDLVLQAKGVVLETISGLNALLGCLVLISVLLSFLNHAVNLLLCETSLVVGDGDGLELSGALVASGNLQDSVCVKLEGDFDLWDTTWCGWDTGELELSEEVVIFGHGSFSLKDLD